MAGESACPRCGGQEFGERECGPDSYEDDITYTSDVCTRCGLWHSGWTDRWLVDCDTWLDEEGAEEYSAREA